MSRCQKALLNAKLWTLLLIVAALRGTGQAPPNIILILADDLGYETLPAYGGESYQTPSIDRLSAEGMTFRHCYAQPQCTPSRVQLLTGIYNVRNYVDFGRLEPSQTTVAQMLQNSGYTTAVAGKWQLGTSPDNPRQLGFDDFLVWQLTEPRADAQGRDTRFSQPVLDLNGQVKTYGFEDYGPKVINEYSLAFIEQQAKAQKPFFLFYSMMLTHCPFSPTPDSPDWMQSRDEVLTYKGDARYFPDMVRYMDKMVGNILRKVDSLGIAQNTIIVFTGDNGTDTPVASMNRGKEIAGGKLLSTDAGTHVPLVVRWPGHCRQGVYQNDLVDFTDFMPTLLEVAGIPRPVSPTLDGVSFLPALTGKNKNQRDWIYSWYQNPAEKVPVVFARDHRFKLYGTGKFFDVRKDVLEQNPLLPQEVKPVGRKAYDGLKAVLDAYGKRRLDAVAAKSEKNE